MKKTKKKNSLKNIYTICKKIFLMIKLAKVPVHYYLLTTVIGMVVAPFFVGLPALSTKLMAGNGTTEMFKQYSGLSIANMIYDLAFLFYTSWYNVEAQTRVRMAFWNRALRLKQADLDKEKPLTLVSRVTVDADFINKFVVTFLGIFSATYNVFLVFNKMYELHGKMVFWILGALSITIVSTFLFMNLNKKAQSDIQTKNANFTAFLAERMSSLKIIKAHNTEEYETLVTTEQINMQFKADVKYQVLTVISNFISGIGYNLCTVIIFGLGSKLIAEGTMTLEQLVAFYMYSTTGAQRGLVELSFRYLELSTYFGALDKIMEIFNSDIEELRKEKEFKVTDEPIVFENVSFSYGKEKVLDNLSFSIPSGKITAIVGPSGSGKTTILKLLERFYPITEGKIKYGNTDLEKYHLDDWRNSIGYVVQNSPIMAGSIKDNIAYSLHEEPTEQQIIDAAKVANAYGFINEMPDKFDSESGELGSNLSGGQRQRIAIARAIIKKPDILLLDEATCSLDPTNEYEVSKALANVMAGRTTVVVAHNMTTIRRADNIVVLDKGKVAGIGTHEELYENNALYRKYCLLQFEGATV